MRFAPTNGRLVLEPTVAAVTEQEEKSHALKAFEVFSKQEEKRHIPGEDLYTVVDATVECSDWIGKTIVVDTVYPYEINGETVYTCLSTSVVGVVIDEE